MKTYQTIDKYISVFPKEIQDLLEKMRQTIQAVVPKAEEAMRYGMPTFRLKDKNLVHFAAYKKHIGFYPTPSPIEVFKKELSIYKTSKGAIQFPIDKPIPFDLIRKIVEYRVKEMILKR